MRSKCKGAMVCHHRHRESRYVQEGRGGLAKDDVSPQDIFRLTNGSSADRSIIAKYCLQDCNLVHHLLKKIDVVTGCVGNGEDFQRSNLVHRIQRSRDQTD